MIDLEKYGIERRGRYSTFYEDENNSPHYWEYCLLYVSHGEWDGTGFPPSYYLAYSDDYDEIFNLFEYYKENPWDIMDVHGYGYLNLGTKQSECGFVGFHILEDGSVEDTGISSISGSDHLFD